MTSWSTRSCERRRSSYTTSTPTGCARRSAWPPGRPRPWARTRASRRTSTVARPFKDADFVVDTIQVGGARATQIDFDIPARYGLRYTINDTINVGGVMRGLRSIPVVLDIVRDMEELCPDAWFLNYTNPMAMLVRAVAERSEIKDGGPLPLRVLDDRHARRLPGSAARGGRLRLGRRQPPGLPAAPRAPRPRPLSGPARVRRSRAVCPTTTWCAPSCSAAWATT